jgi:hypothetical protein
MIALGIILALPHLGVGLTSRGHAPSIRRSPSADCGDGLIDTFDRRNIEADFGAVGCPECDRGWAAAAINSLMNMSSMGVVASQRYGLQST